MKNLKKSFRRRRRRFCFPALHLVPTATAEKSLILTNQISSIGFGGLSYTCIAVVAKRGLLVLVLGEEEKEDGGISRTIGGGLSLPPFSSCFVAVSNLPPLPPPFAAIVVGCMERRGVPR